MSRAGFDPGALAELLDDLDAEQGRMVVELATGITAGLREATPVDTRHAASNWIPSIGAPVSDIDGSEDAVSSAMQDAGIADLLSYRLSDGDAYVQNHVPYIGVLNDGWSDQKPAGFVEDVIEEEIMRVANRREGAMPTVSSNLGVRR